jgi:3-oxoacyl-(acyl-carrier-protein) synthase
MKPTSGRRVAITGVGVISSIGLNRSAFWDSIVRGLPGIRPMRLVDCASVRFRNVAEVRGYLPENHEDRKALCQKLCGLGGSAQRSSRMQEATAEAIRSSTSRAQPAAGRP